MGGYVAFSLIVTVLLIPLTLKLLRPLRSNPSNPYKFAKPHSLATLESFTGYASEFGSWTQTKTYIDLGDTVTVTGSGGVYRGTVTRNVLKSTSLHTEFFLNRPDGTSQRVHLKTVTKGRASFKVPYIGAGQLVSVVWDSAKGIKSTAIIRNHSTRETAYGSEQVFGPALGGLLWRTLGGGGLGLLVLLGLFAFPLGTAQAVFFFILQPIRVSGFKRKGAAPLIQALDQRAAEVAAQARATQPLAAPQPFAAPQPLAAPPQRSASDELSRLYELYQQGAITADEYERAKQAVLKA